MRRKKERYTCSGAERHVHVHVHVYVMYMYIGKLTALGVLYCFALFVSLFDLACLLLSSFSSLIETYVCNPQSHMN